MFWGQQGLKRNLASAVEYFKMSAETGDAQSQYDYGIVLMRVCVNCDFEIRVCMYSAISLMRVHTSVHWCYFNDRWLAQWYALIKLK